MTTTTRDLVPVTALAAKRVSPATALDIVDMPAPQLQARQRARVRERVQAEFGLLYTTERVHEIIRKRARWTLLAIRTTRWWAVEPSTSFIRRQALGRVGARSAGLDDPRVYERVIPDEALRRYHEARRSGLFEGFAVVEPDYEARERTAPVADPWLLGQIGDEWAVLAYWD